MNSPKDDFDWPGWLSLATTIIGFVIAWKTTAYFSLRAEIRGLIDTSQSILDEIKLVSEDYFSSDKGKVGRDFSAATTIQFLLNRLRHQVDLIKELSSSAIDFTEECDSLWSKLTDDRMCSANSREKKEKSFVYDLFGEMEALYQDMNKRFWEKYGDRNLASRVFRVKRW